jgi:hypothetical protein
MERSGRDNCFAPSAGGPDRAGKGDGSDNALKKATSSAASMNKLFERISLERDL